MTKSFPGSDQNPRGAQYPGTETLSHQGLIHRKNRFGDPNYLKKIQQTFSKYAVTQILVEHSNDTFRILE